jgi:hypothetical protein
MEDRAWPEGVMSWRTEHRDIDSVGNKTDKNRLPAPINKAGLHMQETSPFFVRQLKTLFTHQQVTF